jgi:hypothetical protein
VVGVDGGADGFAPGIGAEGVDVFVLGQAGGLEKSLELEATVRATRGLISPRITAGMRRPRAVFRSLAES